MNNKTKYTVSAIASAALVFNFSSCKYEEGPAFSLKSKKARLAGEWEITRVNGDKPKNFEVSFEFEKKGDVTITYSYSYYYYGYNYTYDYTEKGEWEWEDKKETIDLSMDGWHDELEVKRLTSKELWVETSDDDEWELEKK